MLRTTKSALGKGRTSRSSYCFLSSNQVGAVLGAGSFGVTYRCRDEHLDTTVAITEYDLRHATGRAEDSLNVRPHADKETESCLADAL